MSKSRHDIKEPLLGPKDPPPYDVLNRGGGARCILICDHGGRAVPEKLGLMGMAPDDFDRHYAHDIGTRRLTQKLADRIDAPAIIGNYSRLVVDVNRRLDHPTAFVTSGEDRLVPANESMSPGERALRIQEIYEPYHRAVEQMIDGFARREVVPAVISIHSFAPVFFAQTRPWEVGVLWVRDPRLPRPLIDFFRNQGLCVGDNEPYDARMLRGTTINHHADMRGLPNALLEIRNDLLETEAQADLWAERIEAALAGVLAEDSLYSQYDGPMPAHDTEKEKKYFDDLIEQAKKQP